MYYNGEFKSTAPSRTNRRDRGDRSASNKVRPNLLGNETKESNNTDVWKLSQSGSLIDPGPAHGKEGLHVLHRPQTLWRVCAVVHGALRAGVFGLRSISSTRVRLGPRIATGHSTRS